MMSRISAWPAKMPLATRAANRRLGSTGGIAGASCASRWATGSMCPLFGQLSPRGEGGGPRLAELAPVRRRGVPAARAARRAAPRAPPRAGPRARRCRRPRPGPGPGPRPAPNARAWRPVVPRRPAPRPPPRAGACSAAPAPRDGEASGAASSRSISSRSVVSSSSFESKRYMRSVRVRSSPGVCGPRSMSTARSETCGGVRPSAWSSTCLYLTERAVDQLASVVHLRRPSRSSAERTVPSS